ncbi:putative fmnh2-dependent monooxygenase protein [Seiridium cardinale]
MFIEMKQSEREKEDLKSRFELLNLRSPRFSFSSFGASLKQPAPVHSSWLRDPTPPGTPDPEEAARRGGGDGRFPMPAGGKNIRERDRRDRICGLQKRWFWGLIAVAAVVLLGVCIGVGVGVSQSKNNVSHSTGSGGASGSTESSSTSATATATTTITSGSTATSTLASATTTSTGGVDCPAGNDTTYSVPGSTVQFLHLCGLDYSGDGEATDIKNVQTDSMADCMTNCAGTEGCTGCGWGYVDGDSLSSMSNNTFKAEQARAAASSRWLSAAKPDNPAAWVKRAAEVAEVLKFDAVERDAEKKPPFAEVKLLKDAGLVNLLGPREYGGGGETWQTSYKVTTEVAKADGSIGHLLGNHYSWFWSSQILGTPEQARRWLREFTEGNYYLGGAVNPRNADMIARDIGDELVFNGDKFFSTGGVISDVTVLEGVLEDDVKTHVFAFVSTQNPGISFKGDWDVIGQRLTESGGCVIKNVHVSWEHIAGWVDKKLTPRDAYHDFILPPVQLQFAAVHVGVGLGAIEAAAEYTRSRTRAWPYGGDDKTKASDEWYIREGYGRLQAKLWAAEALVSRTAEQVSKLIHAPREELTQQARGEVAVQVAASKAIAIEAALEASSKIFEVMGASSSLSSYGFDRFFRNTRGKLSLIAAHMVS